MAKPSSKSGTAELVKTTLFKKEPDGVTYRIPSLLYLPERHTYLAFAEKRTSPSDSDAKILVIRRGTITKDGSIQVWQDLIHLTHCNAFTKLICQHNNNKCVSVVFSELFYFHLIAY